MSRKLHVIDHNGSRVHVVPEVGHKPWTLIGVTLSQDEHGNKTMQSPVLKDPVTGEAVTSITSYNANGVWVDLVRKAVEGFDWAIAPCGVCGHFRGNHTAETCEGSDGCACY